MWSSVIVDAFLSQSLYGASHPFQTGRVFFPLVQTMFFDTEANYMSDRILKLYVPVPVFFPISTDPQKCVFISKSKKGVHIFCSGIPSTAITSVFSEGQLIFDRT